MLEEVLPEITAEGAAMIGEWETENNIVFTKTITVDKTTTIIAGNQELTVQVDNKTPVIKNVDAYVQQAY